MHLKFSEQNGDGEQADAGVKRRRIRASSRQSGCGVVCWCVRRGGRREKGKLTPWFVDEAGSGVEVQETDDDAVTTVAMTGLAASLWRSSVPSLETQR